MVTPMEGHKIDRFFVCLFVVLCCVLIFEIGGAQACSTPEEGCGTESIRYPVGHLQGH